MDFLVKTSVFRRFRSLLAPLVGLLVVGLFLGTAEVLSYGFLRFANPHLADAVAHRHALKGPSPEKHLLTSLYPVWGWGNPRVKVDPSAEVRIVVLGGSTVWGRQSIPHHLEKHLERRHPMNFDVINAGMPGWYSVNEAAYLSSVVLPFLEPDYVIVLDGYNDVMPALKRGLSRPENSAGPGEVHPPDPAYHHPTLDRYRRQFRALQDRPLLVFNQFLHAAGVAPYLQLNRTFTGVVIGEGFGIESFHPFPNWSRARDFWRSFSLPPDLRRRARRRLRNSNVDGETILRESLPEWRRNRLMALIGSWSDRKWTRNLQKIKRMTPDRRRMLRRTPHHSMPYEWIERSKLPCQGARPRVDHYLTNVKSMLGSARAHGASVLYALQPTIVFKNDLTPKEKRSVATKVSSRFFSATSYHFPPGTCWHRVTRHFFVRTRAAFQEAPGRGDSSVRTVDLSGLFARTGEPRFTDFVHYNEPAQEAIAQVLTDQLASMGVQ